MYKTTKKEKMEFINFDTSKNILTVKYENNFYSHKIEYELSTNCKIICAENLLEMLYNPEYTSFTLDNIEDTLSVVINYVEKTKYIHLTDTLNLKLKLEENSLEMRVNECEKKIQELTRENQELKNAFDMRITRHMILPHPYTDLYKRYVKPNYMTRFDNFIINNYGRSFNLKYDGTSAYYKYNNIYWHFIRWDSVKKEKIIPTINEFPQYTEKILFNAFICVTFQAKIHKNLQVLRFDSIIHFVNDVKSHFHSEVIHKHCEEPVYEINGNQNNHIFDYFQYFKHQEKLYYLVEVYECNKLEENGQKCTSETVYILADEIP